MGRRLGTEWAAKRALAWQEGPGILAASAAEWSCDLEKFAPL